LETRSRKRFFFTQAQSLGGGIIDSDDLVQGGQYLFLSAPEMDDEDDN